MSDKLSALPLITTVQPNSRFYLTDPAEPVPADQSKAIEWTAMAKALGGSPTTDCELYVSKTGNDTTGNGSILAPFLTIQAAINSVTDATANKQYTIIISPGFYNETLTLKAWVHLSSICANGVGEIGKGPVRITGSATINFASATNGIVIFSGIDLDSGGGSLLVLGQGFFYLQACRLGGLYGCESSSSINYIACLCTSTISFTGGSHNLTGCRLGASTIVGENNTWLGNTTITLTACRLDDYLFLRGVSGGNVTTNVYACKLVEVRVNPTSGTPTVILNADSSYRPSLLNLISGTITVNLQTEAAALKYTAADPTDWAGTPPVTVQEAIDDLAASAGPVPSLSITTVQLTPDDIDDIPYLYTWFPIGGGMANNIPSLRVGDGANSVNFVKVFTSITLDAIQASDITFDDLTELGTINGNSITNLESLSFPALTRVYGWLEFNSCGLIDTISVPVLTRVDGYISIVGCALVTLDLSSVEVVIGNIDVSSMTTLTSIDISGLLQLGDNFSAAGNALTETAVDDILVKLASMDGTGGTTSYDNKDINLSGGTNATPSATGLTAKATLQARGCTVMVN